MAVCMENGCMQLSMLITERDSREHEACTSTTVPFVYTLVFLPLDQIMKDLRVLMSYVAASQLF